MAASLTFPGRLYHINDSGESGRFYITEGDGSGARVVNIAGFTPRDTEALSLGPCPRQRSSSCLYIGDIGDNGRRRKTIEVLAVEETPSFSETVKATARFSLRYPDGPHNAESMAVHPDGSLFILTKTVPPRLYSGRVDAAEQTLALVTTLAMASQPTDMAISADGSRLVVLSYREALESTIDFKERRNVPLSLLQQQESLTYLPNGHSIIYSTERVFAGLMQPLMRMDCRATQQQ